MKDIEYLKKYLANKDDLNSAIKNLRTVNLFNILSVK